MNRIRPLRQAKQASAVAAAAAQPASFERSEHLGKSKIIPRKQRGGNGSSMPLRVLNVGCGIHSGVSLPAMFKDGEWQEIRLDIDSAMRPDIVASATDLNGRIEDESCDAIWSSHTIEHLSRHEVHQALSEFHRVLVPTGFALIRCPDAEIVAEMIVAGKIDDIIYTSAAGPITPLDILYGHGASIARGNHFMRHGTAFTENLLARDLVNAGFAEVRTIRPGNYEVWAAAFMPDAKVTSIVDSLAKAGLDLRIPQKPRQNRVKPGASV
jgi:ubiquinone/menaquinone biosynthesis C-methylase UbiE